MSNQEETKKNSASTGKDTYISEPAIPDVPRSGSRLSISRAKSASKWCQALLKCLVLEVLEVMQRCCC